MKNEKIEWMKVAKRIGAGIWILMVAVAKATAWVAVKVFNATIAVIAALATAFVAVSSAMPADEDDHNNGVFDYPAFAKEGEAGLDDNGDITYSGGGSIKPYYG